VFPRDAREVDSLLRHADTAMSEAKQGGRGRFSMYAGGTQEALQRLTLPSRLREALEQRDFVLHFQPIFSLAGGEVFAVEALLRWRDARRGLRRSPGLARPGNRRARDHQRVAASVPVRGFRGGAARGIEHLRT